MSQYNMYNNNPIFSVQDLDLTNGLHQHFIHYALLILLVAVLVTAMTLFDLYSYSLGQVVS